MQVGICLGGDIDFVGRCAEAGYDYVEMSAVAVLEPRKTDAEWAEKRDKLLAIPLPLPVLNLFFTADLVFLGPQRDLNQVLEFADVVLERARLVGAGIQVFGSGKARTPPEGYDKQQAMEELLDLGRRLGPLAARHNVIIAMEHLRAAECTLLTSIRETLDYVRQVNHPNIQLLIDSYHAHQMDESTAIAVKAADCLKHVHTADGPTRLDPVSGNSDLRPLFGHLKAAGYDGRISLECRWTDREKDLQQNCRLIRQQWDEAACGACDQQ